VFEKIYEIITGCAFFHGVGARGLLGAMARMVGEVPSLWASYWASNEYLKDQGVPGGFFFSGLPYLIQTLAFQRSQLQGQMLSGSTAGQPLYGAVRVKKRQTV
jgi:hypothetical protein